ncbi:hypothetical protein XENORESO_013268 [Xenotaenia resolanae]|uniref:Uncharacterized protein n=1 Tax=Xenotaenia resolanae TaxID=208358 RepID=A0ABV0WWQ3_9TELE
MFAEAAADLPPLNCSITRLPNGSFRYQLSQPTSLPDCDTYWEDHNHIVIARDSFFNETLVEDLTDEHIDLKICQHHLRHETDCLVLKRIVDCRVNCSLFDLQSSSAEFSGAEPPSPLLAHLRSRLPAIISVIIWLIFILILGVLWKCRQKTSSSSRTFRCFFNQNRKENTGNGSSTQYDV